MACRAMQFRYIFTFKVETLLHNAFKVRHLCESLSLLDPKLMYATCIYRKSGVWQIIVGISISKDIAIWRRQTP